MNQLIKFTDAAVTHIMQMMNKHVNGLGFRISIKKTGCSGYAYVPVIIDKIIPEDIHFVVQNQLAVFVDPASESFLKDVLVDYVADMTTGLKQKRLVFTNPQEKNRCGCGESFTIE